MDDNYYNSYQYNTIDQGYFLYFSTVYLLLFFLSLFSLLSPLLPSHPLSFSCSYSQTRRSVRYSYKVNYSKPNIPIKFKFLGIFLMTRRSLRRTLLARTGVSTGNTGFFFLTLKKITFYKLCTKHFS